MAHQGKRRDPAPDADAAVVDKLLRQLGRRGAPAAAASRASATSAPPSSRFAGNQRHFSLHNHQAVEMRPAAIWARVGLGTFLGVALALWPYERGCGWGLSLYLIAVGVVIVTGVWGVLFSWKSRLAAAHVVALATMLWGVALAATEILPRVGYATVAAAWRCAEPSVSSR